MVIEQPGYLIHTSDFSVRVPTEYLGKKRSDVKLLSLNSRMGTYSIQPFTNITGMLHKGDLLVFNNSSIVRSSLTGYVEDSDGLLRVNFGYNEDGLIAELRDRINTYYRGDSIRFVNGSFVTLKEHLERYGRFWKVSVSDP
ncbi:S-adenosylmethionine:tRNA ribosyltransferase-isomerase, partial [mine drainage metagenome]